MQSEIDKRPYAHECAKSNYTICPACIYAEGIVLGRKAERERFLRIISMTDHEHRLLEREEFLGEKGGQDEK